MHFISEGAKGLCGFDPDDLLNDRVTWESITHPDDVEMVERTISEAMVAKRSFDLIYRILDRQGRMKWVHERGEAVSAVPDQPPALVGFIMSVTLDDLTIGRGATVAVADEAALRRAANVALQHQLGQSAMAGLAATIAHELNQPLTAITMYSATLKRRLEGVQDDALEVVEGIQANTGRSVDILRRLRFFVETGRPQLEEVNCRDLVLGAVGYVTAQCGPAVIVTDLDAQAVLLVDRVQVQQVLVNLLLNACEAVARSEGGQIHIRTCLHGERPVWRLSISNNGPAIPGDLLHQIFEAGTTTKPEGTGLGLPISRTIVEAHGGTIRADPVSAGAQITVELPVLVS
jgi:signal transduction histidine kinase